MLFRSGFASDTEQEIALLYDPDRLSARHDPKGGTGSPAPRFDGSFHHHLDGNSGPEVIRFDKPPLEILLTPVEGRPIRLIGVHVKSKAPHGAQDAADVTRLSIQNRRKQLAQCLWIRQRVEGHLTAGDDVIVLGDFNDGPGLDEYEKLFGQSGVEVVLGTAPDPGLRLYDPHAAMALQSRVALAPTTARFYLAPQKRFFEALLDFIMVSRSLAARQPAWRIWHPFNDPAILADPGLSGALLRASDHFPVTLDLPIVN